MENIHFLFIESIHVWHKTRETLSYISLIHMYCEAYRQTIPVEQGLKKSQRLRLDLHAYKYVYYISLSIWDISISRRINMRKNRQGSYRIKRKGKKGGKFCHNSLKIRDLYIYPKYQHISFFTPTNLVANCFRNPRYIANNKVKRQRANHDRGRK